jgi:putative ABC transport system permease protein
VAVALRSLRSSKLRSFLTLLGIILATSTLISVTGVIHGMDLYIAQTVSDMGSDGFRVVRMAFIGDFDPKKFLELQRKNPQLSRDEYEFLRQRMTLASEVGMQVNRRVTVSGGADKVDGVQLISATPNVGAITNVQVSSGRSVTDAENERHIAVTLVGNDIKEAFFPNLDPLGKQIKIDGRPFTIVGVAKPRGSAFGQSLDNFVSIPIETGFQIYGSRTGIAYVAKASDTSKLFQAQDEMRMLLRAYRHVRPGRDDNFAIISSDSLVDAWGRITGVIAGAAVAIVSVFMIVGGVVIMNIMLAVVSERTHEIGIRKSVGARRQDILYQFLVESSVLSACGGIIGVLVAATISQLVNNVTPVPMALPLYAVVLGVGLSTMVGLFFGIYPAQRAARLDPIEALRVER